LEQAHLIAANRQNTILCVYPDCCPVIEKNRGLIHKVKWPSNKTIIDEEKRKDRKKQDEYGFLPLTGVARGKNEGEGGKIR
jgi:hypothetical protein